MNKIRKLIMERLLAKAKKTSSKTPAKKTRDDIGYSNNNAPQNTSHQKNDNSIQTARKEFLNGMASDNRLKKTETSENKAMTEKESDFKIKIELLDELEERCVDIVQQGILAELRNYVGFCTRYPYTIKEDTIHEWVNTEFFARRGCKIEISDEKSPNTIRKQKNSVQGNHENKTKDSNSKSSDRITKKPILDLLTGLEQDNKENLEKISSMKEKIKNKHKNTELENDKNSITDDSEPQVDIGTLIEELYNSFFFNLVIQIYDIRDKFWIANEDIDQFLLKTIKVLIKLNSTLNLKPNENADKFASGSVTDLDQVDKLKELKRILKKLEDEKIIR